MPITIQRASVLLKDLVRFPSLSGEEGAIADFVEDYVREAGLPVERFEDNVYFWLGEGEDDVLLLNTHLDVVPPSEDHPYPPFEPTEVDGALYGRGSVDAKASGAAMTTALLQLAQDGFAPPGGKVMVALTTCEETGGAYNGLETLRPHLPPLGAALVGEPTEMAPCVAQKGLLILNLHARGRTAHAARAERGDNAILRAMEVLRQLEGLTLDEEHPFLGKPTVTPTVIEGGSARNVVPDRCTVTLDIRSTPDYPHDELIRRVEAQVDAEVEVHSKRIVPVATDPSERIARACRQVRPDQAPFGSPTASDWIFLSDVPCVKIGPGDSRLSHTAEEHIPLAAVEEAATAYREIIQAYFSLGD